MRRPFSWKRDRKRSELKKLDGASIPGIYKAVAATEGRNPDREEYDCRCIFVARNIFVWYKDYKRSVDREESIGMLWLYCGPKV